MKKQRKKSLLPKLPASVWWLFPLVAVAAAIADLVWGASAAELPGLEPFLRPSGALLTGLIAGLFVLLVCETLLWRSWRSQLHDPDEHDWPSKAFESCQNQVGGDMSTTTMDLRIAVVTKTCAEIAEAGATRLRWYATFALAPLFGAAYSFVSEVQQVGQAESFSVLMYPGSVAIVACFVGTCWVNGLWWICRSATIEWETWAREKWELNQGSASAEPPTPPPTLAAPQPRLANAYSSSGFQGSSDRPAATAPQPTPPPAPAPFNPFGAPVKSPAAASASSPNDEVVLTDRDIYDAGAAPPAVVDPLLGATAVATEYASSPPAAQPWQDTPIPTSSASSSVSSGSSDTSGANRETASVDVFLDL